MVEIPKGQRTFSIIIENVDQSRVEESASEFAKVFGMDLGIITKIIKSAPIVFLTNVTRSELKAIIPMLTSVSTKGTVFRVTTSSVEKIPKVTWPIRPQFTIGETSLPSSVGFKWDGSAFVCPNCGETFLFRRLGKLPLAEDLPLEPTKPKPSAVKEQPKAVELPKEVPLKPKTVEPPLEEPTKVIEPLPEISLEEEEKEPIEFIPDEEQLEELEKTEPLLEPLKGEPLEFEEVISFDELPSEGDSTKLKEPEGLEDAKLELIPLEDDASKSTDEGTKDLKKKVETTRTSKSEKDFLRGEAPSSRELYSVFLSKISSKDAKEKAIDLIAQIKKVSKEEARELSNRMLIPLLKDAPRKDAEEALEKFRTIGVSGKMTKQKKQSTS